MGVKGHDAFTFTINLYQFMATMRDLTAIDVVLHIDDEGIFSRRYLRSDIIEQSYIIASPVQPLTKNDGNMLVDMTVLYEHKGDKVSKAFIEGDQSAKVSLCDSLPTSTSIIRTQAATADRFCHSFPSSNISDFAKDQIIVQDPAKVTQKREEEKSMRHTYITSKERESASRSCIMEAQSINIKRLT